MTKILIGMLSLALVGTGGLVAAVDGFGGSDPLPSVSLPSVSDGSTTAGTTTEVTTGATTGENEDVSGPCDEAEHANDPRCTGGAVAGDDDDRGGDDRGDNSGPGSTAGDDQLRLRSRRRRRRPRRQLRPRLGRRLTPTHNERRSTQP